MNDIAKVRPVTTKQAALVDALVANGCSITEAARLAGYADGESGRVTASKALRLPHVQMYMMERIGETLGLNATVASAKLVQLAKGAKSEYVQLEASKDILDRAGYKAPDRQLTMRAGDISVACRHALTLACVSPCRDRRKTVRPSRQACATSLAFMPSGRSPCPTRITARLA